MNSGNDESIMVSSTWLNNEMNSVVRWFPLLYPHVKWGQRFGRYCARIPLPFPGTAGRLAADRLHKGPIGWRELSKLRKCLVDFWSFGNNWHGLVAVDGWIGQGIYKKPERQWSMYTKLLIFQSCGGRLNSHEKYFYRVKRGQTLYAINRECLKMLTVCSKRPSVARRLAAAPPSKKKLIVINGWRHDESELP